MARVLGKRFFARDSKMVARSLLGCYLVRRFGKKTVRLKVTETESYGGKEDLASHARFGKTRRNAVMFGEAGRFYVYFVYGFHWLLNIVTGKEGQAEAVLIRGTEEISGPGRLTKTLNISGKLNGKTASKITGLWFETGGMANRLSILSVPRIGVGYAGPVWAQKPYRFLIKKNPVR